MVQAIQIDTLAFAKKLRAAGADERLADAIVEGITAADTSELATKSDVKAVETALKADIANVETALKADIADVRSEISTLKTELKSLELRMTIRLGGIMTVGIGVIATLNALF